MGTAAGRILVEVPSASIVSFLDDWSIASTAESDANDIANIADADDALANPAHPIIREYGYVQILWMEPAAPPQILW